MVSRHFDSANARTFSPEELARLDAMSPGEIESNARSDPDNPPVTEDELERGAVARTIRRARERSGLSRPKFAARYRIDPVRLLDWEHGRFLPDSAALAYICVIEREPEAVERALAS